MKLDQEVDTIVRTCSKLGVSKKDTLKELQSIGKGRCRKTIYNITKNIGKFRSAAAENQPKPRIQRPRKVLSDQVLQDLRKWTSYRNPPSLKDMALKLGINKSTVRYGMKLLNVVRRKKRKVLPLSPAHIKNRKTNSRKLYDSIRGSKSEFAITLDEAMIFQYNANGETEYAYVVKGKDFPDDWTWLKPEHFSKSFMVVAIMTGRGTLPLIRVKSKAKINADYYIKYVLHPLYTRLLPKLYTPDEIPKLFIHHDKAPSHTAKKTQDWAQKMKSKTGITLISNGEIPVKCPEASPLDFFGFGYLKGQVSLGRCRTLDGIWKKCRHIWISVTLERVRKVFNAWKRRLRRIYAMGGQAIENIRSVQLKSMKLY